MNQNKLYELGNNFDQRYCNYFQGENVTDEVTQAYWQCLNLTKKRLDRKHINLDIKVQKKGKTIDNILEEGSHVVGYFSSDVKTEKIFKEQGRILHRSKVNMKSRCNVIATDVTAGEIACPNCGGIGTMESYIDGCDYCGSKFKLEDFKEKVSSYLLEEDAEGVARKNTKRTLLSYGIGFILLILLFILSLIVMIITATRKSMYVGTALSVMGYIIVTSTFKPFITSMAVFTIILIIVMVIYTRRTKSRVNSLIESHYIKIGDELFSDEKFAENVEIILRTIHFANQKEEINAFSHTDLSPLLDKYKDVLECNLSNIVIMDYKEENGSQYFNVKCILNITSLKGKRIKEHKEVLYLSLSRRMDIKCKDMALIHHYSCPNCGASIDMLKGGVCEHCGTRKDMTNYGWMIESYHTDISWDKELVSNKEPLVIGKSHELNPILLIRSMVVAGYFIIAVICYNAVSNNEIMDLSYFAYLQEAKAEVDQYMDKVPLPEDTINAVTLTDSEEGLNERTYQYRCDIDVKNAKEEYSEVLLNNGFYLKQIDGDDNEYVYLKENGGYAGNTYVKVSGADSDTMLVTLLLDDMDEDAWTEHIKESKKR